MLPDDSFLRKLPQVYVPENRMQTEALLMAADIIEICYDQIHAVTERYQEKILDIRPKERVKIFSDLWTIVDQLHVVRQVLPVLADGLEEAVDFCAEHEAATLMRNRMDHLHQAIPNLVKSKKRRPPVFGSLSYVTIPTSVIDEMFPRPLQQLKKAGVVTLLAGTITDHTVPAVNPIGKQIRGLSGAFRFDAFGYHLDIDEMMRKLNRVLLIMNENSQAHFEKWCAERMAENSSLKKEQLDALPPTGLVIYMEMSARTEEEWQEIENPDSGADEAAVKAPPATPPEAQ